MMHSIFRRPLLPAVLIWLAAALLGLVPPFSRDAMNDHLMLPMLWQEHGLFWRNARLAFTAYPPMADIPYLLFAGHAWDPAASLWHACGALLTLVFLRQAMDNLHVGPVSNGVALLAWLSAPIVIALCTWSYVDLWLCAAAAAMTEYLSRARWRRRDAWLFGIVTGLAALVKYNGIPLAIGGLLALAWRWRQNRRVWIWVLQAGIAGLLVAGWWYMGNWRMFGHALYLPGASDAGIQWLQYRELAYHEPFFWAALAPLRQFFWGEINHPRLFDGMLHPLWLLGLPACWRLRASSRVASLGMAAIVYALFALSTSVRARYWLPGMTMLIPLLGLALTHVRGRWRRTWVAAGFIPGVLVSGMYIMALSPWTYWMHGREAFLLTHVPDYAITRWADTNLPKQANIYLLWTGGRAYYLRRTYHADFMSGEVNAQKMIVQRAFPSQSYLLMNRKLADKSFVENAQDAWRNMLGCSRLLSRQGAFQLWKINACTTAGTHR